MICFHRKRRIGRFREIKACRRCGRAWVDWQAMGMAQADAYFAKRSVAAGYSEDERRFLKLAGVL